MLRTLIAGFGNVLRGDDGFGVEVIHRLEAAGVACEEIRLLEVGTGGLALAQELLAGYDRLIIVDAMTCGGAPGTLYVREVEAVEDATDIDMHLAVPARALSVAKALGVLPDRVFIIGCEPTEVDELLTELSLPVRSAVDAALRHIHELVAPRVSSRTEHTRLS